MQLTWKKNDNFLRVFWDLIAMIVEQIRAWSDNHYLGMRSGSKLCVQVTSDQGLTRRMVKHSVSATVHLNCSLVCLLLSSKLDPRLFIFGKIRE